MDKDDNKKVSFSFDLIDEIVDQKIGRLTIIFDNNYDGQHLLFDDCIDTVIMERLVNDSKLVNNFKLGVRNIEYLEV